MSAMIHWKSENYQLISGFPSSTFDPPSGKRFRVLDNSRFTRAMSRREKEEKVEERKPGRFHP